MYHFGPHDIDFFLIFFFRTDEDETLFTKSIHL